VFIGVTNVVFTIVALLLLDRVETLTTAAFTVPTDAPEADGTFAWSSTTLVLVRASSQGETGTGWTYAPAATTAIVEEALAPVVLGCPAMDVGGAWGSMVRHVRNSGRHGLVGYAISAVDVALWDLKARLLGLPLHRLLGAVRSDVPVYGSGGFTTYDDRQLSEQLTHWTVEQRIPRVKIKIGESWGSRVGRDVERMRQAREVVGADVELFVDANGAYGAGQAIRVMDDVRDLHVRWFEEPVSSDDLEGLRLLRQRLPARMDLAAGEYAYTIGYVRRMLEAEAVDVQQADVTRCGGFTGWLQAAVLCDAHHIDLSGHCAPTLHLHAVCAAPRLRHLEWFHGDVRIEHMLFDGAPTPEDGVIRPDLSRPGMGWEFKRQDAEKYRVQ
jgi:L-alanine-DL-glutamate epimerase-like enolase superfamily enzyme